MGRRPGWATAATGRPAMRSPGRPPVARREHGRGSGRRSLVVRRARMLGWVRPACRRRWGRGGSVSVAACRLRISGPHSGRYLSFGEREEIAICRAYGYGVREIARHLGRSPSTVSRELRRNAGTRGGTLVYRAVIAQWHRDRRAARPKTARLVSNEQLREYVQDRLAGVIRTPDGQVIAGPRAQAWKGRNKARRQDRRWATAWSPEQIALGCELGFPDDESMRISHEAIYQALYVRRRGALQRELVACLRTGRALRVPRARARQRRDGMVTPAVMISARPAEAADRAVAGHWEGDLIIGLDKSAIGTLVERTTRFTMLLHLPRMDGYGVEKRVKNGPALAGHGAQAVRDAITASLTTLPGPLRQTLTWDRGKEMAQHAQLRPVPASRCSSLTRTAPGSAAPTRTPTACCASTSPRAPTWPAGTATNSAVSRPR